MILNTVGGPIHLTTGRRLVEEFDPALGTVVVMLDGELACARLAERYPDLEIVWGAQPGSPTRPWSVVGWPTCSPRSPSCGRQSGRSAGR